MIHRKLILLWLLASVSFLSLKAQTPLQAENMNYLQWPAYPENTPLNDSIHINQKWQLNKYAGIFSGFGFFSAGPTSFMALPVGLQLSRELNKNLYAFTAVSAAPVLFNFNRAFTDPAFNKYYPGNSMSNAYQFGFNSRVEVGLMYINDAKTFSISGSIGVERGSYPLYPANRVNKTKQ